MIKYELKRRYKSTIVWSVCMVLLILVSMVKGDAIISTPEAAASFSTMPPIMLAIFGINSIDVATPFGYFSVLYAYIVVALAIHGVMSAINIFTNEEMDHTYEYLLTKPIKRNKVFISKVISSLILILIVDLTTFITSILAVSKYFSDYPDLLSQMIMLCIAMFLFVLLCVSIGYIIMGIMQKGNRVTSFTLLFIMLFYILNVVAIMLPDITLFNYISPMQVLGPVAIYNDDIFYIGYVIVIILFIISIMFSYFKFNKKEIL